MVGETVEMGSPRNRLAIGVPRPSGMLRISSEKVSDDSKRAVLRSDALMSVEGSVSQFHAPANPPGLDETDAEIVAM